MMMKIGLGHKKKFKHSQKQNKMIDLLKLNMNVKEGDSIELLNCSKKFFSENFSVELSEGRF